jgi:ATP-dependent exoDNAse (exonuclease V) beta subunit
MPSTSEAINPHNVKIEFYEDTHTYKSIVDGKEIDYISVSTLAGKYFPKFESEKIAGFTAKKRGISTQEVLDEWSKAGKDACIYGTRIHETCEDTILNRPLRNTANTDKEKIVFPFAINIANKFKKELDIIGVEYLVFNEKLKIAGTIDLLAKSKTDNTYYIIDWKTNKSIDVENKYGNKGLYPIQDLDDTNYVHYALQLGLYEYILKSTGYINTDAVVKKVLIHLNETKPQKYELPDMSDHVKNIILENILN